MVIISLAFLEVFSSFFETPKLHLSLVTLTHVFKQRMGLVILYLSPCQPPFSHWSSWKYPNCHLVKIVSDTELFTALGDLYEQPCQKKKKGKTTTTKNTHIFWKDKQSRWVVLGFLYSQPSGVSVLRTWTLQWAKKTGETGKSWLLHSITFLRPTPLRMEVPVCHLHTSKFD